MAPKAKDFNRSGLGRAIINQKIKDARRQQDSGLYNTDMPVRLESVTQERDLDEFFNNAKLAGTDFAAERQNIKIIQQSTSLDQNPYLPSESEERNILDRHAQNRARLRVPRRPPWTKGVTTAELDKQEKAAFLNWRRGLAKLQEEEDLVLTPFERNLEVWRQLWRVIERSHLVVQIVDARNPLRFRCEDLEAYVSDIEGIEGEAGSGKGYRKSLLLINKADLLSLKQRCQWADYFDTQGIQYAFFSAANAAALQKQRLDALAAQQSQTLKESEPAQANLTVEYTQLDTGNESGDSGEESSDSLSEAYYDAEDGEFNGQDPRAKILSVRELEHWFTSMAPDLAVFNDFTGHLPSRLVVGLVGYPNVGKSSTINSLLGEKKVSVSSTPGKTKHFQTIHLSDSVILCDCPGLVFPQFATTRADLVCDGVLPIDQLREYTGPATLVVRRIPKDVLEATYGLSIRVLGVGDGGDGRVTAENFLISYAIARGYTRSGQGNPDESRSARYVLKDYVSGKLLFCHPPPGISEEAFNQPTHEMARLRALGKKRAPTTRVGKDADTYVPETTVPSTHSPSSTYTPGSISSALDRNFFNSEGALSSQAYIQSPSRHGEAYVRTQTYVNQTTIDNDGISLVTHPTYGAAGRGKKHHKKIPRTKQRSGRGYD